MIVSSSSGPKTEVSFTDLSFNKENSENDKRADGINNY